MKTKVSRFLTIMGIVIVLSGYCLNWASRKYLSLYRSLQYRNLKLEEALMTDTVRAGLFALIGILALGVLVYVFVKKRQLLKTKPLSVFGVLVFSGQSLTALGGDSATTMGIYIVFLGYVLGFIGFAISLFEKE